MAEKSPLALPLSALADAFTPEALALRPEPISTGWPALDRLIGGIAPGLYVLGAISGLGKSTFALQMAEQIAGGGSCPVLYFSLEMTSLAIAAKSLSRRVFLKTGRGKLESRGLLRPQPPESLPKEFEAARREMAEQAGGLFLVTPQPGGPLLTARKMVELVRGFCEKNRPQKPPLVIVDYLQIIPSPPGDSRGAPREITDENVNTLRRGLQDMPVLLISSLNRGSYDKPIQLFSFKESGGIEYSADVLLGLQFSAVREKGHGAGWLEQEKQKLPREVEIVVLKQRYGSSGDVVKFRYYAPYDFFQQENSAPVPAIDGPNGPAVRLNNTYLANEARFFQAQNPKHPADQPVCITVQPFGKGREDIQTTLTLSRPLRYWDLAVADGIFTLFLQGHGQPFRTVDLLRLLNGGRAKKGSVICGKLEQAIERMRNTDTAIQCAAEMAARFGEGSLETLGYSGPFLRLDKTAEGYAFPQERLRMPLYQYAQDARQVLTVPAGALATPTTESGHLAFSCTEGTLALKHYLARAVKLSEGGGGRWSGQLNFTSAKGLFPAMGVTKEGYPAGKTRSRKEGKAFAQAADMLRFYRDRLGLLEPGQAIPEGYGKAVRLRPARREAKEKSN